MKADLKNPKQIQHMQEGGQKLSRVLKTLLKDVKVGQSLIDIEKKAYQLLLETGGKPGFTLVPGYKWATCLNVNDGVVHGIPNQYIIQDGDTVSIDIGLFYKGLHTDTSYTLQVGTKTPEITHFLQAGHESLRSALKQIKPGRRVGHISHAMQTVVEKYGYRCIPDLTGHGIGKNLHEYPAVPGVLTTDIDQTPLLKAGMTLAVEVIYTQGDPKTYTDKADNWTIRTSDGKIAAMFEKTIAVVSDGYVCITP